MVRLCDAEFKAPVEACQPITPIHGTETLADRWRINLLPARSCVFLLRLSISTLGGRNGSQRPAPFSKLLPLLISLLLRSCFTHDEMAERLLAWWYNTRPCCLRVIISPPFFFLFSTFHFLFSFHFFFCLFVFEIWSFSNSAPDGWQGTIFNTFLIGKWCVSTILALIISFFWCSSYSFFQSLDKSQCVTRKGWFVAFDKRANWKEKLKLAEMRSRHQLKSRIPFFSSSSGSCRMSLACPWSIAGGNL